MLRLSHVLALFLVLAFTGCCKLPTSAPKDKIYNMSFPADNTSGLRITQIVITATETRIRLRFQNLNRQPTSISTAPPGQMDTFFVEAADQTRRYGLVRATGISISPNRDQILPGGMADFTLFFPPINATWSPIDLHEGEIVRKGMNYWSFTDIPLR